MSTIEVLEPGPLTTVQDLGRPGLAALGVSRSGAADRSSLRLANRLVGNPETAAALEITGGGLLIRATGASLAAVTGASCPMQLRTGRTVSAVAGNAPFSLAAGAELAVGPAAAGLRAYLALRGGVAVPPVLGSRSTDTLSGLGPAPLRAGDRLPVGAATEPLNPVEIAPVPSAPSGDIELRVFPVPRADRRAADAADLLCSAPYRVRAESDRVGMRLDGPALRWASSGEVPTEALVAGALQVTPSGTLILFLADHPVTGGYPVVAVVAEDDVDRAAQARPGQTLKFRRMRTPRL